MHPLTSVLLASVVLVCTSRTAAASELPWQLEVRSGATLPLADLGEVALGPDYSHSATLAYRFTDTLSVHAGWGSHLLAADEIESMSGGTVVERGYLLGLGFRGSFGKAGFGYRLRAGATYASIDIENVGGDRIEGTGHGPGFELGGVVSIPVNRRLSVTPGLRFRSLSHEIAFDGRVSSETLTVVVADVGVAWRF